MTQTTADTPPTVLARLIAQLEEQLQRLRAVPEVGGSRG